MTVRFLALYETPPDPEAFDRHYRDVHIPLGSQLPGLRRYAVNWDAVTVRGGTAWYLVADLPRRARGGYRSVSHWIGGHL